jgi:hypothetical protein
MAVLSYAGNDSRAPPLTPRPACPAWDDAVPRVEQSRSVVVAHLDHALPVPPRPNRTFLLLNANTRIDVHVRWVINGVSLRFPATPYLVSMKRGLRNAYGQRPPADAYDHRSYDIGSAPAVGGTVASAAYRVPPGRWWTWCCKTRWCSTTGASEMHPWHLHEHDSGCSGTARAGSSQVGTRPS